jgi:hypothetical protein
VADVEGRVFFIEDSILPTQITLDFLVQTGLLWNCHLDEFLRLLQDEAKSSLLQNTVYAQVSVEGEESTRPTQSRNKPISLVAFSGLHLGLSSSQREILQLLPF